MMIKTLFLLSFLFFIYSFIGWILEVVQSAFHQKRFGKPWFYQLTTLYFLWNRSYRYYDQYASDDRPMDLCCRHDRCHSH